VIRLAITYEDGSFSTEVFSEPGEDIFDALKRAAVLAQRGLHYDNTVVNINLTRTVERNEEQ
jgi:hypothetical protein